MEDSPKLSNSSIARTLREVAAAYEIKGENQFKVKAYNTAADSVEHATSEIKDLWEDKRLDELPGVGTSIAAHLDELFKTGKVKHFAEVEKGLPQGMFALFGLEGVGTKRALNLAKKLKVESISDLYHAAQSGEIAKLEGFGQKSQDQIVKAIERKNQEEGRMVLPIAFSLAEKVIDEIKKLPGVTRADPLGSLRRMVSTVGDIDIGVATTKPQETLSAFTKIPEVSRILAVGESKASVILRNGVQIDIRVQDDKSYGGLLQYFTGSKSHNIHLRKIANQKGLSLSEYGIAKFKSGKKVGEPLAVSTEEEFYKTIGLPYIPPEIREDTGEIEAAQSGNLPKLVTNGDVLGEVHVHTQNSPDGEEPAEEMVKEALSLGRKYIGIADHSPSVVTRGLDEARKEILKRKKEVEELKKKYQGKISIFFGAETNIDSTGKMALPDELLKLHDYVIASIHTSFDQSKDKITARLVAALENPYVNALGHPTGRLLTQRASYDADWDHVFKVANGKGKALEINAYPLRLDLPDGLVRRAREAGVKFIISTDAHQAKHFGNLKFGTATARRGWCERSDILNTEKPEEFAKVFSVRG